MNSTPEARLIQARLNLQAALERGDDSAPFRNAVLAAERGLAAAQAEQATAEREQRAADQQRLDERTTSTVSFAHTAVEASAGASVVEGVEMPSLTDDPAVTNAAARLAAAEDRLQREQTRYDAAHVEWTNVGRRLAEKQQVRDLIVARRAGGDERPEDAAELQAITLDIGSLQGIVADKRVAADNLKPLTAQRLVVEAGAALKKAQDAALFSLRKARIRALELALIDEHTAAVIEARAQGLSEFTGIPMLRDTQRVIHRTAAWEDR
ncbi:hypothetical protein FDX19_02620 [Citrobacter sp. wls619]|uniref:hypothetical protein n=1 Tax=Citrobacter sp. wls619 TaxID=2576432 RepID=UPI0010C9A8F7|nr:hypothetical protein [Citrobacter sp. wls619]TKV13249.1 hypothetical protein FDX19_02620 [Citrobacter sp. wls619]